MEQDIPEGLFAFARRETPSAVILRWHVSKRRREYLDCSHSLFAAGALREVIASKEVSSAANSKSSKRLLERRKRPFLDIDLPKLPLLKLRDDAKLGESPLELCRDFMSGHRSRHPQQTRQMLSDSAVLNTSACRR